MEERNLKVNFNKSGSGSYTPRLCLPITDLRKMKVTPENREVKYYYDEENEIMIISQKEIKDIKIKIKK